VVGLFAGLVGRWVAALRRRPALVLGVAALVVLLVGAMVLDLALWWDGGDDIHRPVTILEPLWRAVAAAPPASDESLLERANRWRCCLRMAADRPLTGFGPGTFEREYGAYQRDRDRTRWTTHRGDLGDAHSEFLGRLAEEGAVGALLEALLLVTVVLTGLRTVRSSGNAEIRAVAAAWTGAVVGLAVASLSVSDLPGTGLAPWLAAAVLMRLDVAARGPDPHTE